MQFQDLLEEWSVETATDHHHARAGWIQFDCPFCGEGTGRFHMGYNTHGGYVNCWRCGRQQLQETVSRLLGVPYKQAGALLAKLERGGYEGSGIAEKARGKLVVPVGVGKLTKAHRQYLRSRGFNPQQIADLWGIQGIGLASRLSWRIYIPFYVQDTCVSWTTRSIADDAELRYIGASPEEEALNRRHYLYGEDYCRHSICVHEGPTDAWAIGPGATCTMGVGYSQQQLVRIAKYPLRIICFDGEPEAQARARQLVGDLSVFPGRTLNVVLDAKDAATAKPKERAQLRKLLQG